MIEGSLRNVPLTDVLQIVTTGQKSGVLVMEKPDAFARIFVESGKIQFANLQPGPHLGEILVRMGALSARDVQTLLDIKATQTVSPLGQLAVERSMIKEEQLTQALRQQAVEVLAALLSWKDGQFSFAERDMDDDEVVPEGGHDAMRLLMAADTLRRDLDAGIADPGAVFERAGDPTKHTLPEGAWDLLGMLDGRLPARTIVAETDLTETDGLRILHRMAELGVIRETGRAGNETVVLVLCEKPTLQRLLRLSMQRAGMRAEVFEDEASAFAGLDRVRPHVVLVDGRDESGWNLVRRLRDTPGRAHLPALVLEDPKQRGGLLNRWRRPKATTMDYPFDELELQRAVARLAGRQLL